MKEALIYDSTLYQLAVNKYYSTIRNWIYCNRNDFIIVYGIIVCYSSLLLCISSSYSRLIHDLKKECMNLISVVVENACINC
jgi:hypothetical protein